MPNPQWEIPFDKYGKLNPAMRARGIGNASKVQAIKTSTYFKDLNELTTLIQVTAISKDMMFKWTNDSEEYVKATNMDEYIPAGTTVELMIPLTDKNEFYEGFQVAGIADSGSVALVEK